MDFLKLLQSLEGLLYELALWVILLPKTLFKVTFQPKWAYEYVIAEWEKKPEDRFEYYMSPILFWAAVVVVPYVLFINSLAAQNATPNAPHPSLQNEFLKFAVGFLAGPLGVAVTIQRAKKAAVGRKSLKRTFYTQCLCFGPASLLFLPYFHVMRSIFSSPETSTALLLSPWLYYRKAYFVGSIFLFGALGWLTFAEANIITRELDTDRKTALRILVNGLLLSYLLGLGLAVASGFF